MLRLYKCSFKKSNYTDTIVVLKPQNLNLRFTIQLKIDLHFSSIFQNV